MFARSRASLRRYRGPLACAAAGILALSAGPAHAHGTSCTTSGPPSNAYSATVCIEAPADGSAISGTTTVTASVNVTGANPGIRKLIFRLDGEYLLTDYEPSWTFRIPTDRFVDGPRHLEVEALMRDGYTAERAGAHLSFANSVLEPPANSNQFTPTSGRPRSPGEPFVVAHVGDGASGETTSDSVRNLIRSWNPNLFVYTGDVYDKGTATEFFNWGKQYFDPLREITNPAIGNHEYENGDAPGYFDYWDNVPHHYSYDAGGWHFVALDSTFQFGEMAPGSGQYEWLRQDLESSPAACTAVYMHHPRWNIGPEGVAARTQDIWRLLSERGVDLLLTSHDHTYQRWETLGAEGEPDPQGITQFVVGTGGHGIQEFVTSDQRVKAAFTEAGAQRLELNAEGAAYRFINTNGVTLDSGSVHCNGTPPDGIVPSTPGGLQAVAEPSSQAVGLTWDAASDNVGVTGYDVYRDGALLTRTGPETSWRDSSVAAGSSYMYEVRARDAAGNVSESSAPSSAATDELAVLFAAGFESGDMSRWDMSRGLVAQQQEVFSGSWGARGTAGSPGAANYAYRNVGSQGELYYQARVKLLSQGANTLNLLGFKTATGAKLLSLYLGSTGKLGYRNEVTGASTTSSQTVTRGAWHTIQARLRVDGAAGLSEVWLDGTRMDALSKTASFGTTPIGRVELGDAATSRTYDIAFDDVAVDPNFIADRTNPVMSDRLAATSGSGLQVRLDWDAAWDDVGVTGYEVYRNGTPLTTTGPVTSFTDRSVRPHVSYYYEVRARDAAGNLSHFTDVAAVDTPALFDDGFESGDLSNWTLASGIVAQGGGQYSGAWAARATGAGTAAYAYKDFPSTQQELFYRLRFKILSQGANPVNLLRFRTETGSALLTLYATSSGKLAYRNDVAGTSHPSSRAIGGGAWHEVQAHLRTGAADGLAELWLDGRRVDELSGPGAFGSSQIRRIEAGESTSGKTYDVVLDDVRVDTVFIPDTTPPTRPGGLSATAVRDNRVDLAWTPSSDNVGVTGYDVYRNGTLITHIDPAASYTDLSVAPNTAYSYELRATDAGENESEASNQASVVTPATDSEPPSAPASLTGTAVSPDHVDLSWAASQDNVDVTGYDVYRDGQLLAAVGRVTTYRDAQVAADQDHRYTVRARDAADNVSPPSAPADVRVALFSDGFETGDLSRWKGVSGLVATGGEVFAGAFAARATSTAGTATQAHRDLPSPQTALVYRMRFKVLSQGATSVYLMKLRTAAAGSILGLYRNASNGVLVLRNDVAGGSSTSSTVVTTGAWHELELRVQIDVVAGLTEVFLDGQRVDALSGTRALGTTGIGRVQLGENSTGRIHDIAFDDVVVDRLGAP